MNKHQLLDMMNSIRDKYVMEAVESREQSGGKAKSHLRLHRVGLLAAVLAALLLLAGCVAVYLRLQDMSVRQETYMKHFDENGKAIEPTEKVRDVLNIAVLMDTPAQNSSTQWYEFTQSYDPDHALMTNEPDIPGIANNYEYIYGCYTQEMVDKLDEIAGVNQVKLLEARVPIDRWGTDIAMEALGRTSLFREGANAAPASVQGMLYAPYNFRLMYSLTLTGEDAPWKKEVYVTEVYQHNGYLPSDSIWTLDLDDYQQWRYTTGQGIEVLLAVNHTGNGLMVCPRDAGVLTVSIYGNLTGSSYPEPDQVPGKEAMEAFAEVIDFDVTPSLIDPDVLNPKLDAAQAADQAANEVAFEEPVYESAVDLLLDNSIFWWSPQYRYQYTYYDLDSDGEKELLLGRDGKISDVFSLAKGDTTRKYLAVSDGGTLCQDGSVMFSDFMPFSQFCMYRYVHSLSELIADPENARQTYLTNRDGQWVSGEFGGEEAVITQEKADAIRARHVPLEMGWKDIMDFPMDDSGQTLGDYIQTLENPDNAQLRERYAQQLQEDPTASEYYRIMDLNGDGVDDLLLSSDGERFWSVRTCRYGKIDGILSDYYYLCEGNVLENVTIHRDLTEKGMIEMEQHIFYQVNRDFTLELVGYATYNKATASWQSDRDGTPMSTAEAEAILAKYPRIDQGMHPISELLG